MHAYIKEIAKDIVARLETAQKAVPQMEDMEGHFFTLREELDRLDPLHFSPESRFRFVNARREIRRLAATDNHKWDKTRRAGINHAGNPHEQAEAETFFQTSTEIVKQVLPILDAIIGPSLATNQRSFTFVTDIELRKIIERDYRELMQVLLPDGAWKSSVIMAGSILESILYDQLTKTSATILKAMASTEAPKKGNRVRDITKDTSGDAWDLCHLIKVAVDLEVLPNSKTDVIDNTLREYRNFVHPKREIRAALACGEAEATLAKGALLVVCDHLK